jgi:hypothetical protein
MHNTEASHLAVTRQLDYMSKVAPERIMVPRGTHLLVSFVYPHLSAIVICNYQQRN